MAVTTVELNASREQTRLPLLWRLDKLFNVVVNIRRARVTEDYAYAQIEMQGATQEIADATAYLQTLGILQGGTSGASAPLPDPPENAIPQPNAIEVELRTVNPEQGHSPILHRVGKDYTVVVNILRAAFDDEEGGTVDILISGLLTDVQRAIAYLHTTGIRVNPRQRSVTDYKNL